MACGRLRFSPWRSSRDDENRVPSRQGFHNTQDPNLTQHARPTRGAGERGSRELVSLCLASMLGMACNVNTIFNTPPPSSSIHQILAAVPVSGTPGATPPCTLLVESMTGHDGSDNGHRPTVRAPSLRLVAQLGLHYPHAPIHIPSREVP